MYISSRLLPVPSFSGWLPQFVLRPAGMSTLSNQNFGLIIAYLLPGFVSLWGVSYFSPTVESWINVPQQPGSPSVAGFMYVTLASLAAGVSVSAVRWAIIDHLHHATGVVPPVWKFANLEGKLQGYLTLVENHYRYYQFSRTCSSRRRSRFRQGFWSRGRHFHVLSRQLVDSWP